eukprot:49516_1
MRAFKRWTSRKPLQTVQSICLRSLSYQCQSSLKRIQRIGAKYDVPFNIKLTNVGSHICTTNSSQLESISVNQLKSKPNTIQYGKILQGKITSDPQLIDDLNITILTIQDEQCNDILLQIHNANDNMYKQNGLISIKEPIITYCNNFECNDEPLLCIQTDNWYYNIVYDEQEDGHEQTDLGLQEEDSLKNMTHNIMKYAQKGQYKQMFEHIENTSSKLTDKKEKFQFDLFLPMIYLQSKQYHLGINAALDVLKHPILNNDMKPPAKEVQFLIIDLVMMYAKLRRYDACIEILRKYFPSNELNNGQMQSFQAPGFNVSVLYKSFLNLSKHQKDGEYKLEDLQHILHLTNKRDMSHSIESFYGNIEIQYMNKDRGRGVVATKDIKKDEIICVEQAAFYEVHGTVAIRYGNMNNMNQLSRMVKIHTFTKQLLNYIYHNNCEYDNQSILMRYRLSQLCGYKMNDDGSEYDVNAMNVPDIDLFRYEQLPSNISNEDVMNTVHISAEDIRNVVLQNAFSIYIPRDMEQLQHVSMPYTALQLPIMSQDAMDLCDVGTGLFWVPSFFNHENDDKRNAYRIIYGHFMFIVALKDIKCGEEIFHPYYPRDADQDVVKSFQDRFV